ncbi:hypothetical protein E4U21_002489 [Claviceps maximensis]|nr:hypothetical protein E4U21_002489 [Claviceps maximensis]
MLRSACLAFRTRSPVSSVIGGRLEFLAARSGWLAAAESKQQQQQQQQQQEPAALPRGSEGTGVNTSQTILDNS